MALERGRKVTAIGLNWIDDIRPGRVAHPYVMGVRQIRLAYKYERCARCTNDDRCWSVGDSSVMFKGSPRQ